MFKKSFKYILFDEKTALHIAVAKENIPIIKLLLKKDGIKINIKDGISFICIWYLSLKNWMIFNCSFINEKDQLN